ncbi:MAG: C25 family cysteine peptidase [Pirellulales bacterium]
MTSRRISIVFALFVVLAGASRATYADEQTAPANEPPARRVAVVCPAEWRGALDEWKRHRAAQGYAILDVDPTATAPELRDVLAKTHQVRPLTAVLLIGDAPAAGERGRFTPTFLEKADILPRFGGEAAIATDFPYADLDADGVPETAVGRWPVRNVEQLRTIAGKTLAYERSRDFGPWRGRINLVAGAGGFGPLIDAAIEQSARTILLSGLPAGYHPTLTFGSWTSPHCPDPRRLRGRSPGADGRGLPVLGLHRSRARRRLGSGSHAGSFDL